VKKILIGISVPLVLSLLYGIASYAGDGLKQETVKAVTKVLAPTTEELAKIARENQKDVQALQRKHALKEGRDEQLRLLCEDGTIQAQDPRCKTLPPRPSVIRPPAVSAGPTP
jgi:hypothetical protein